MNPSSERESNQCLSVVIPARNEQEYLPCCLLALKRAADMAGVELELVVVLNRCTDGTEAIARDAGAKTVVEDAKNLSLIRNAGVAKTSHPIVVTVDADTRVAENLLVKLVEAMRDKQCIGGGVLRLMPERWSAGIFFTGLCLLPIALRHGISGGVFFFRRTAFDEIGGFDATMISAEDIDFAKRLKRHAERGGSYFKNLLTTHVITSCRKFDKFGDWYFLRNPKLFWTLLKGKDQQGANQVWYDFPRE